MRRIIAIRAILDYAVPRPSDMLIAVEAEAAPGQTILFERLTAEFGPAPSPRVDGTADLGPRRWLHAPSRSRLVYEAEVAIDRPVPPALHMRAAMPRPDLPAAVIPFLLPSRYCEADRLERLVEQDFAGMTGGALVAALAEWVHDRLDYRPGSSDGGTTALDTLTTRVGVCRDYAHLLVALARAAGLPARLVSVYGADVVPPDFHALAEVWLEGGWHMVDPSRLADPADVVRLGAGRDAADIAFLTVFGEATLNEQSVTVTRVRPTGGGESAAS